MAGDFNIIPQPEDAANIDNWEKDALFLPESRAEFRKIINLGFTDAFRAKNFGSGNYSFWDYQAGAWDRDDGVRRASWQLAWAGVVSALISRRQPL